MSGTADWSDTTNTLNNTVKHIHVCYCKNKLTKTKKKVVEIINFKTPFYKWKWVVVF